MAAASSSSALAVGIAVGGACIGAGLYFGLRARAPETSASLAAPSTTVASATTRAAEGAAPTALQGVDVAAARAEVLQQLEAVRSSLRDQCWAPSVARTPMPDRGSFTFQYTFDATGKQIARGIAADQGRARADVAFCLTGKVPNVTIAPQGASVRLSLSFPFP